VVAPRKRRTGIDYGRMPPLTRVTCALALFTTVIAGTVRHAGAQAPRDPLVREGATKKISPHVYVIPDDDVPLVPNVGIIVGNRATLVVDTGLGPKNGEAVLREVAKASSNRTLYLAVTHVHPEHDLGAQAFPPETQMLRSRGQDADIAEFGLQLAETFASQSPVRAQLLKGAVYRKTDISFDRSYVLDLGGVRVRMEAVGPTHTRGDTVFFVEGDAILFAGDVVMSALPAFASPYSSVRAWLAALDRLEAMKPTIVVPSHGRLVDAAAIARYREYLRDVQSRTQALKREGRSADDAAQIVQSELQAKYKDMPQPGRIAGAAKAAYQEP
jgi:glyoxylase-like metal-dependent hydrolase (beta-lactamase superfamily II)